MKLVKKINVELNRKGFPKEIDVVQYDTGLQLECIVKDFDIPDGTIATLYAEKPSGKFVYQQTGIEISDNTIIVDLENQVITEHGKVWMQITLSNGTDTISTFEMLMEVQKSRKDSGAVESTTVIRAFDEAIEKAVAQINEARDAASKYISESVDQSLSIDGKAADAAAVGKKVTELDENLVNHHLYYDEITDILNNKISIVNEHNLIKGSIEDSISPNYLGTLSHRCVIIDLDAIEDKIHNLKIDYTINGIIPLFKRFFFKSDGQTKLDYDREWRLFSNKTDILISVDELRKTHPEIKYMALDMIFTTDGTENTFIDNGISDVLVFRIYQIIEKRKTYVVVDKNGNGDFTTIQSAIDATIPGDTILVNNGTYEEEIRMYNKERRIIGKSKENTFIISKSKEYGHEPLQCDTGYISNLTIIGGYGQNYVEGSTDATSYAVHIDNANVKERTLIVENCNFISNVSSAVGMGVRYNQKVIFKNCYFETNAPKVYSEVYSQFTDCGAIFCHNDASGSNLGDDAYLSIENCELKGVTTALSLQSQNNDNEMKVRFINNVLWSKTNRKNNAVTIRINPATNGHIAGNDIILDDISFGNNINLLNA